MDTFPKYPTDFCAMTRPFEDEEIEKLLSQDVKDVAFTISMLKAREVNATKALDNLKKDMDDKIQLLKRSYDKAAQQGAHNACSDIDSQIKLLESFLV